MEPTTFTASAIIKSTSVLFQGVTVTAAATAGVINIRRGPLITSPIIFELRAPINTTVTIDSLNIRCHTGIYAEVVSGAVVGTVTHN